MKLTPLRNSSKYVETELNAKNYFISASFSPLYVLKKIVEFNRNEKRLKDLVFIRVAPSRFQNKRETAKSSRKRPKIQTDQTERKRNGKVWEPLCQRVETSIFLVLLYLSFKHSCGIQKVVFKLRHGN